MRRASSRAMVDTAAVSTRKSDACILVVVLQCAGSACVCANMCRASGTTVPRDQHVFGKAVMHAPAVPWQGPHNQDENVPVQCTLASWQRAPC